jgi:uncharacterized protein YcbK (DUF882 family)
MTGPSPHLSWAELACADGTEYPHAWRASRAVALARAFEALRAAVGQPLVVLSGYRTPGHNKRIGGAKASQHVEGRALDLRPPAGWTPDDLADMARDCPGITGLGVYPTFVHIDVRPATRLHTWRGSRPVADKGRRD